MFRTYLKVGFDPEMLIYLRIQTYIFADKLLLFACLCSLLSRKMKTSKGNENSKRLEGCKLDLKVSKISCSPFHQTVHKI